MALTSDFCIINSNQLLLVSFKYSAIIRNGRYPVREFRRRRRRTPPTLFIETIHKLHVRRYHRWEMLFGEQ
jgi:hypothetical protein